MLPCNDIPRTADGGVEVSAIGPVATLTAIVNEELANPARRMEAKRQQAIEAA